MNAYVDTSVLLRLVLGEAGALDELPSFDALVSSELIAVESLRTIDRLRVQVRSRRRRRRTVFESRRRGSKRSTSSSSGRRS